MKNILLFSLLVIPIFGHAQKLETNISVHDPVIIKQDSVYYIFCTGMGISVWSSTNMKEWRKEKPVFDKAPQWAVDAVPGFKGHVWAPDISFHNGMYYLYYAASAFGKNTSCIGLAINKTLDPRSPNYKWTDLGKVIQSVPNRDMWNAIDPNLIVDENKTAWLDFGSFWDGIKLVKLDSSLQKVAQPEVWHSLASRSRSAAADSSAGDGAIEAPFIFKKGKYYYLFVSFDYCCRGPKSTYKMMVGRSEKVTGPYLDKDNKDMALGGGSLLLQGDSNWYGVGHNAVATFDGRDYLVFHGYDAHDNGKPKLRIEELTWINDWPVVK